MNKTESHNQNEIFEFDSTIIKSIAEKNKIPESYSINRFASGQSHRVYDINHEYIIKIEGDLKSESNNFTHQQVLTEQLIASDVKVPQVLDSGEINEKPYLLMGQVKGRNLVYEWLEADENQKENYMQQAAEQLRKIHAIKHGQYEIPIYSNLPTDELYDSIVKRVDFSTIDKDELKTNQREDIEYLETFYENNKKLLHEQSTAVLVHGDFHFENIFFADGKLSGIIDWDSASYAPKDYEFNNLIDYIHRPKDYVEENLKSKFEGKQLLDALGLLKKYYPELFQTPDLKERIGLYYLEQIIGFVRGFQSGRWSENVMTKVHDKVADFYKNDWLDKALEL